ncbi:hypothetical protein ASL83_003384 [Vibrio parahaemolyticus]|nr:hypothetical protein [Vibrio parahaemolyticus]
MSFEQNSSGHTVENQSNQQGAAHVSSSVEGKSQGAQVSKPKKTRRKSVEKTVFNSLPLLRKLSGTASTQQLKSTYEALGEIVSERVAADEEAARIEREQTNLAEQLVAEAKDKGLPLDVLMKVLNK